MGIAIPQVITNRSGAQVIDGSLKFNHSNETHLVRTPGSGNRRTFTWSCWVKLNGEDRSQSIFFAGPDGDDTYPLIWHASTDNFTVAHYEGGYTYRLVPSALHRDTGWYHVVTAFDTTQSTSSNRIKFYINGEQITDFSTETYPSQNYANSINESGVAHRIAFQTTGNAFELNGSLSQCYFIDGQQLDASYFGFTDPLTNTWKPKKYKVPLAETVTVQPTYVSNSSVLDPTNAFDGSSATEATYSGTGSWLSFTVSDASNLTVPFRIRNDSSGTGQTVAMFTDSGGSSAAGGFWGSTGTNNLSPAVSTTVDDTYTFPSTGTYYLRHTVGSDSNIFVYKIGGDVTTGANSFYLPMDGNSPIGKDQSGNGNDWTPVNFGGSIALDKATGAKPILNTTQGGNAAGVGVFGSRQNVGYAVTVYNDGGGNKYYIDGVKQDTVTGLIRGATYTFDTSDSTVSSHPFRFSATSNGSHGGGSEYTNGVAAITGAATTITVPHDAPNTLYYYCTSHSGMGADITGITTNEKLADQYASNCVLAVPFVGSTNDASAGLACTSTTKADTNSGSTASSTVYHFYIGSRDFDGSNDTCSFASVPACGAGDWTVEFWLYSEASAIDTVYRRIVSTGQNNAAAIQIGHIGSASASGGYITYTHSDGGVYAVNTSNVMNRWAHIAVVRESGSVNVYTDGIKGTTAYSDSNNKTGTTWYVSGYGGATDRGRFNGKIQDLRVYPGIAKYTSNFVPASPSPDILPDTPSGVTGGSKLTKITDGAVSFDGDSDYLLLESNSDLAFGTGDFTFEFFVYMITDQYTIFFDMRPNPAATQGLYPLVYLNGGTSLRYYTNSADRITGPDLHAGQWYHIAVSRSGSSTRMFLNGVQQGSTYSDSNNYLNGNTTIGCRADASTGDLHGYMSNVRVIKGTALYTGNFTPPTEPLTNVTNTKLLCCQEPTEAPIGFTTVTATGALPILNTNDTGITTTSGTRSDANSSSLVLALPLLNNANDLSADIKGSGSNKTMTVNGDAAATSSTYQYYGGSFTLDGNGDYISTPYHADFSFGSGDFTVEMWVKTTTSGGYGTGVGRWTSESSTGIFDLRPASADYGDRFVFITRDDSGTGKFVDSGVKVNDGVWHHIAAARDGSTIRLFVDGLLVKSEGSYGHTVNTNTSTGLRVGYGDNTNYLDAEVQDVRIYKGLAKYTSSFTPVGTFTRNQSAVSPGTIDANGAVATNFNPFNTDINTVRGQETGYATLNPLIPGAATLTDGNLTATSPSGHGAGRSTVTIDTSGTGKFYFEAILALIGGTYAHIGVLDAAKNRDDRYVGNTTNCFSYRHDGKKQLEGTTASTYGDSFTTGDTIGCSLDCGSGELRFYKNGVDQGLATTITADFHACFAVSNYGSNGQWKVNFGQKPFKHAPPDGFQPLNTANTRPVKVISRPDQYVGVATYTGSGNTSQDIILGFKPDFAWTKSRSTAENHGLFDSVRGLPKFLRSDSTDNEYTLAAGTPVSFISNGINFTNGSGEINESTRSYVAWAWKAGGNKNTFNVDDVGYASAAAAGLDGGTLTPTGASVGTKQGFSIVGFTGPGSTGTYSHGLSQKPNFMIFKNRDDDSSSWLIYHSALGATKYISFTQAAAVTSSNPFNNTEPTSSVFTAGNWLDNSDTKYIGYIWHDVPGLQKFGSFEGNTNADGPFVELGFRPSIVLLKAADDAANWMLYDNERGKINPNNFVLGPNNTDAGLTYDAYSNAYPIDFLSSGFKVRTNITNSNTNTVIYMAWAKAPTVDLYGGGANAR